MILYWLWTWIVCYKKVLNVFISYWVLILQCLVKSGMYMTPFWKKLFEILAWIFYIVSFYKYFLLMCQTLFVHSFFILIIFLSAWSLSIWQKCFKAFILTGYFSLSPLNSIRFYQICFKIALIFFIFFDSFSIINILLMLFLLNYIFVWFPYC